MKNIANYNLKGQIHGYQQTYRDATRLYYRGNWKNNKRIGYLELSVGNMTLFYIR